MAENTKADGAKALLDVAFSHPIKLIANALGVPPDWMLQMGKDNDVKVAALLGTAQHAINQVKAGVDILVVSGTEAGGHCGSVPTMVLIPEVHELQVLIPSLEHCHNDLLLQCLRQRGYLPQP